MPCPGRLCRLPCCLSADHPFSQRRPCSNYFSQPNDGLITPLKAIRRALPSRVQVSRRGMSVLVFQAACHGTLLFMDSRCPTTVRHCLPYLLARLPCPPCCLLGRYHGMLPRPRDTPPRTSPLTWRGARQADGDPRWQCMKCSSRRLPPSSASSHHNISLPQSRAPSLQHIILTWLTAACRVQTPAFCFWDPASGRARMSPPARR